MLNSNMFRFLVKVTAVVFINTAIYIALYFFIATTDIKQCGNDFNYSDYKCFFNGENDAEILVLGNSRARSSLSSAVLSRQLNKKTYNLAYDAANLVFSRDLLNSYLATATKMPSICILEVSWFSFNTTRTRYPHDRPQLDIKFIGIDSLNGLRSYDKLQCLANSMSTKRLSLFKDVLMELFDKNCVHVNYWSARPTQTLLAFDPDKFDINKIKINFPDFKAGIDNSILASYKGIIDLCNKNNVKLILYTSPEAPMFTLNQKDRSTVKDIIIKTAKSNRLEYFDFTVDGQYYNKGLDYILSDSHHIINSDYFTRYFILVLKECGSV